MLVAGPDPLEEAARAQRQRRRRRTGIITAIATVVVVGLVGAYAAYTLSAPAPLAVGTATAPPEYLPAAIPLDTPGGDAWAVSVAGGEDYLPAEAAGLWAAAEPDERRPIASLTKVITALVVLDSHPLDGPDDQGPWLTFSRADHKLYDKYYLLNATIASMPTGSRMTQRDALEMMLVVSASNYAEAVAGWAFGSQSAFLRAADAWLHDHGLDDTRLVEPTGISPRNVSTAVDLIELARIAMADPVVAAIVGQEQLEVPGHGGVNTNTLVGTLGVDGVKTGTLNETGANLLYSSGLDVGLDEPLRITGVVLGGGSRDSVADDVSDLLTSISRGFRDVKVRSAGAEIGAATTPWGAGSPIALAEDAVLFTWSDIPITSTITPITIRSGDAGEVVGRVDFTDGITSTSVDLVLVDAIEPPDGWWRLTHPSELGR